MRREFERHDAGSENPELREFFRHLVESIDDAIVVRRLADGEVVYASPTIERLLSVTPKAALRAANRLWSHVRREDRQRVQSAVEAERAGSRVAIEFRVKGARGADRWIEWRSSLLAMPGFEDCVVGVFRDVTATHRAMLELELATDTLRDQALRDPLTLLWNRRGLAEFALRESSRLQRGTGSLSAILIDVDDFKLCNEHLGYAEGDRVLREIAEVISQSVRPSDIVGRVGGDEFLAILPEVGLVEASVIAERVRAAIDARVRRGEHHVTASLGVALVQAGAITVEGLIRSTQGALRQGKSLGKNRVERARLSGTTFLG